MSAGIIVVAILLGWIAIQLLILPRFGVAT